MEIVVKSKGKFALHAPDCTLHMESYTDEENFKPKELKNDVGAGCDFFTDVPFIEEVINRFPLEDGEKLNWLDLGCAGGSLILDADNKNLKLITTEKDYIKISKNTKNIDFLPIEFELSRKDKLNFELFLQEKLNA